VLALPSAVRADDYYYVMVFGSQRIPAEARYSHSFALFVRATGQGRCAASYRLEGHLISWMPQALEIRLWALVPECGQNLDLNSTFRWVLASNQRISMWGPYPIDADLYQRALRQTTLLESGEVRYKAIDAGYRADRACNCIHAITSITEGTRLRVHSPNFGETASYYITREMEPWILDTTHSYDWVANRLGLSAYPIVHRNLDNPRSGVVWGALKRVVGESP
jgi:hypothetical protein